MKLVSVGELRANLKEHLDTAKNGESVLIGRDNLVYELRLLKDGAPQALQPLSTAFVPNPPDPDTGYICCLRRSPCRHWYFEGVTGLWTNELTGKTREGT